MQVAEDRAESWTDIKPGALYGALARLVREGLVEEVRTERRGNYPERTIYRITEDGRHALETLHDQMLRAVVVAADPFDLALAHGGTVAEETLREIAEARLLELNARLATASSQLTSALPWLSTAERLVVEHQIGRLRTDIAWHEQVRDNVSKITHERN
jgi:DNA-binding PadR family transcriptional regulator